MAVASCKCCRAEARKQSEKDLREAGYTYNWAPRAEFRVGASLYGVTLEQYHVKIGRLADEGGWPVLMGRWKTVSIIK